jgi:RND family efflux transporter MFP subunit
MKFIFFCVFICLVLISCSNDHDVSETVDMFTGARFVRTEMVVLSDIEKVLNYSGQVRFEQAINIVPSLAGRIERLYVREGQSVSENQLLALLDQNSLEQATLNYTIATRNLERANSLIDDGAIDQRSFEEIEQMWQSAKNAYEFAKENLEIRAPFAGIITAVNFREHEIFSPMHPSGLMRLVNNNIVYVEINVSDADVRLLRLRQRANINFDGVSIVGFISFISSENDISTRLNRVRVEFEGSNRNLRNNMFVQVELIPDYRNNVLVIPSSALVADDMVVLNRNGRSEFRRIITGMESRNFIEVIEGLIEGDIVIVEGNSGLENNYPVVEFGG